jgi:acyl carrier protein
MREKVRFSGKTALGSPREDIATGETLMAERNELQVRLTRIFRDVFDDDALILRDDMTADNVERWDSLTHVDLIVAIEKEFKIRLTTGEISGLKSVGQLTALVLRKAGL